MIRPKFTLADLERANEEWGANCGPGALAAIAGITLGEARSHLLGFDAKRYTNPTMMLEALRMLRRAFQVVPDRSWPRWGLCRIQWDGPWTQPGVPIRARYRYSHWIGVARRGDAGEIVGVFDVNAMANGTGWCSLQDWTETLAPAIIASYPRANGAWHVTHSISVGGS